MLYLIALARLTVPTNLTEEVSAVIIGNCRLCPKKAALGLRKGCLVVLDHKNEEGEPCDGVGRAPANGTISVIPDSDAACNNDEESRKWHC
jgi:hypothetical protein